MSRRSSFDAPGPDRRALSLADAAAPLETTADYAAEIARLWTDAHRRFVDIGRHLNNARDRLPHGEFLPMVERALPFGASVAQRLMKVAAAVDQGLLPPAPELPPYSVAYEIAALPQDELAAAKADGLITPTTRRKDVAAWKRGRQEPAEARAKVLAELRRLEADRTRIEARIRDLRQQLDQDG